MTNSGAAPYHPLKYTIARLWFDSALPVHAWRWIESRWIWATQFIRNSLSYSALIVPIYWSDLRNENRFYRLKENRSRSLPDYGLFCIFNSNCRSESVTDLHYIMWLISYRSTTCEPFVNRTLQCTWFLLAYKQMCGDGTGWINRL